MKAIIIDKSGGVENFKFVDVDKPAIKPNEVLIRNKAVGINPVDFKVRRNEHVLNAIYGDKRPAILGWDLAGTIEEVGDNVTDFEVGDNVFGMINFVGAGDVYAEYVAAPVNHLANIPNGISFQDAAASTLAALTALQVLESNIKARDKVLIHAGSGGVGHFAIQIAKSLGAFVISTSSEANREFLLSLGVDQFIDYRKEKFEEVVSDLDFVFDMFNGDVLLNSLKVVKKDGTVLSIPTPDFSEETKSLAQERGVNLKFHMVQSSGEDMLKIAKMLESGAIKPHVSHTFKFEEMGQAHLQQESGRTVGKIVVNVD
ncbi:MAG: NADP-dependent oxidoreductase [bacterium]|nr:NADP-dependent oxidoreductase [bacterium]